MAAKGGKLKKRTRNEEEGGKLEEGARSEERKTSQREAGEVPEGVGPESTGRNAARRSPSFNYGAVAARGGKKGSGAPRKSNFKSSARGPPRRSN